MTTILTMTLVSTHSRLKAAGHREYPVPHHRLCFNTQPPEGGWVGFVGELQRLRGFNTQPPEGGWRADDPQSETNRLFQHTAA